MRARAPGHAARVGKKGAGAGRLRYAIRCNTKPARLPGTRAMSSSHTLPTKPSSILALICLALVHRLRPAWVALPLAQAAEAEGVATERLSRLTTRALPSLESVAAKVTRRGRPPTAPEQADASSELGITRALLTIASSILATVPLRKPALRALIVGAYIRLRAEHQISQKRFCAELSIPTRTLRSWLRGVGMRPKDPVVRPQSPAPRPKRPPRRPRFGFDVVLPETQVAADTTDLSAFGVSLKLIAAQDVGGRDQDLFRSVLVDDHEAADLVARVFREALKDLPGAQAITDQGTPYLANVTRDALDELEAEHAIQREADPIGKATIERAFGSIKAFARPLLALTDRLARAVPALVQPALARAVTLLLLTAILRAYQAGSRASRRADDARGGTDVAALASAAEQSRERSRADDRSARLLLGFIHEVYGIGGSANAFIRSFRRFPINVLREAERTFANQAHRDDIKNRIAYFARLVRIAEAPFRQKQSRRRREQLEHDRCVSQQRHCQTQRLFWQNDPAAHLADSLDAVATHWLDGQLLFDGAGPGRAWMREAIARLLDRHGETHTCDLANGVFRLFALRRSDQLGTDGITAVRAVLDRMLPQDPTPNATPSCASNFAATIGLAGLYPRPPPSIPPC